jgi:hypothetical protein
MVGIFDHFFLYSVLLDVRKYVFILQFEYIQVESGISSCIAPKAGLARFPAEGKYSAIFSESLWAMII